MTQGDGRNERNLEGASSLRPLVFRFDMNPDDCYELLVGCSVRDVERGLILATLERNGGNRQRAAKILGISPRTIRNKLRQYRDAGLLDDSVVGTSSEAK